MPKILIINPNDKTMSHTQLFFHVPGAERLLTVTSNNFGTLLTREFTYMSRDLYLLLLVGLYISKLLVRNAEATGRPRNRTDGKADGKKILKKRNG